MKKLNEEQDQFDTMYEATISYIEFCTLKRIEFKGSQYKQNYWDNELELARDLFSEIFKIEEEIEDE